MNNNQKVRHNTLHIGREIKRVLHAQRRSASWLAERLYCDRTNIYKLFDKESINTSLLYRISKVLNHDFFKDISKLYNSSPSSQNDDIV